MTKGRRAGEGRRSVAVPQGSKGRGRAILARAIAPRARGPVAARSGGVSVASRPSRPLPPEPAVPCGGVLARKPAPCRRAPVAGAVPVGGALGRAAAWLAVGPSFMARQLIRGGPSVVGKPLVPPVPVGTTVAAVGLRICAITRPVAALAGTSPSAGHASSRCDYASAKQDRVCKFPE